MGFLNDSKPDSIYLEVKEEGGLVRPLADKPQSVWVHKIQEVQTMGPNNQLQTIRKFSHETCIATSKNGVGCLLCNTPDPLWHMLSTESQTNRAGKRVDFPKSPIHILPVFCHESGSAKVMKGGNQIFEEMDKWYDAQPPQGKDLKRCDWRVSKTGTKKMTKYSTIRLDATAHNITPELIEEAKIVIAKALVDRNPTSTDKLMQMIRGDQAQAQLDAGGAVASQQMLGSGYLAQQPGHVTLTPYTQPPQGPVGYVAQPQTTYVPANQTAPAVTVSVNTPSFGTPVSQIPPTVAGVNLQADAGQSADRNVVNEFSSWVSMQPEFAGMGAVTLLIPTIKAHCGHVEYHKLNAEQLSNLKTALTTTLASVRAGAK